MDIFVIIGLLALGIILLLVEVLLIPGTTVVGIAGLIAMGVGIYFTYEQYGQTTGHYTLIATILVTLALVVVGFKTGAWEMFSLKDTVEGKFVSDKKSSDTIRPGDKGTALTPLKPVGKAIINDRKVEVQAQTGYIDKDQKIEVVKVITNSIIVKLRS